MEKCSLIVILPNPEWKEGLYFEERKRVDAWREAALKSRKRKIKINSVNAAYEEFTIDDLSRMFTEIEKDNRVVRAIVLHPINYSVIRSWGKDIYDASTTEEVLTVGVCGHIWTANVIVTSKSRKGTICLVGDDKKDKPFVKRFELVPLRPKKSLSDACIPTTTV
jgi:hypothetical protein